jgi:hypothetical protein
MTPADELPLDPRDVDWASEQFTHRISEVSIAVACLSYNTVVVESNTFFAKAPDTKARLESILAEAEWSGIALPAWPELIPINDGALLWLLSEKREDNQDYDALRIDLTHGEVESWEIYCREPLLVRSFYGAVIGFVRGATTACELLVVDGDDGW